MKKYLKWPPLEKTPYPFTSFWCTSDYSCALLFLVPQNMSTVPSIHTSATRVVLKKKTWAHKLGPSWECVQWSNTYITSPFLLEQHHQVTWACLYENVRYANATLQQGMASVWNASTEGFLSQITNKKARIGPGRLLTHDKGDWHTLTVYINTLLTALVTALFHMVITEPFMQAVSASRYVYNFIFQDQPPYLFWA